MQQICWSVVAQSMSSRDAAERSYWPVTGSFAETPKSYVRLPSAVHSEK